MSERDPSFVAFSFEQSTGVKREPMRNAAEVAEMFGFKNVAGLHASLRSKSFPPADFMVPIKRGKTGTKCFWKLSTLKKELLRRSKK